MRLAATVHKNRWHSQSCCSHCSQIRHDVTANLTCINGLELARRRFSTDWFSPNLQRTETRQKKAVKVFATDSSTCKALIWWYYANDEKMWKRYESAYGCQYEDSFSGWSVGGARTRKPLQARNCQPTRSPIVRNARKDICVTKWLRFLSSMTGHVKIVGRG